MAHHVSFISVHAVVFVHGKVVCPSPPSCSGTRVTPERDGAPAGIHSVLPSPLRATSHLLPVSADPPIRDTARVEFSGGCSWGLAPSPWRRFPTFTPFSHQRFPPFYDRASSTLRPPVYRLTDAWLVSPLGLSLRGSYRHSGTQAFVCLSTVHDSGSGFTSGFGRSQGISLFSFSRNCPAVSAAATPFPAPQQRTRPSSPRPCRHGRLCVGRQPF